MPNCKHGGIAERSAMMKIKNKGRTKADKAYKKGKIERQTENKTAYTLRSHQDT